MTGGGVFEKIFMKERVYHKKGVEECGYFPKFKFLFSEILDKDYPRKDFGFSKRVLGTVCIDMDAVEIASSGSNDKTMDCVVGVSDYEESHKKHFRHRLMMVEMKLGCTGFSLKPGDLRGKEKHTETMLMGDMLEDSRVFLFTTKVIGDARRRLSSWKRGSDGDLYRSWNFLTPKEYNDFIRFAEDYPYVPVTEKEDIRKSFENIGNISENIEKIVEVRNYWLTLAFGYRNKGVQEEYDHIIKLVDEEVDAIVNAMEDGDDKDLLKLEFQIS